MNWKQGWKNASQPDENFEWAEVQLRASRLLYKILVSGPNFSSRPQTVEVSGLTPSPSWVRQWRIELTTKGTTFTSPVHGNLKHAHSKKKEQITGKVFNKYVFIESSGESKSGAFRTNGELNWIAFRLPCQPLKVATLYLIWSTRWIVVQFNDIPGHHLVNFNLNSTKPWGMVPKVGFCC